MFEREPTAGPRHHPKARADGAREAAAADAGARPLGTHDSASVMRLQRTAGNSAVAQLLAEEPGTQAPSPVHDVVGRGGSPLDKGTRAAMESSFGEDFGDVRVHTDSQASESAASVGANAYTVGNDIVFRSGHFDSSTQTGQRTLAHELSHVVQQRSGPVDGTEAPGGIRLSDPGDRFERAADATAERVVSGSGRSSAATPSIQTEADPQVPESAPVQREGSEEEEEMPPTMS